MGHAVNAQRAYRLLQERLDRHLTGAPASPTLIRILELLFSPEEAELARRIPGRPTPLDALARKLGVPEDELGGTLTAMARRGVVLDFELGGRRYVTLPPVVIGFFEFTFMRARDDLPMAELARLFERYMADGDRFARGVFQGHTQVGRSLIREETLPEGNHTEILDWERASHLVETASAAAVSLCPCRHTARHLGRDCGKPLEVCMSLNYAAETLVRTGHARPLTTAEAVRTLEQAKDAGLAQTADNVQRKVAFICNCCGCCCGMFQAAKRFDIRNAIVSSNWIAEIDAAACKGCGLCAQACPMDAIELVAPADGDGQERAARDESLCLGCGVCAAACRAGAIRMTPRPQRVYTPETVFDRMVAMAIERGKLADLLFDDPERLSHRALGRLLGVLERSPPFKAAMAVKPLRSAFLGALVKGAKRAAGDFREVIS